MTHPIVRNAIRTMLAGSLALGMASAPALARSPGPADDCGKGQTCTDQRAPSSNSNQRDNSHSTPAKPGAPQSSRDQRVKSEPRDTRKGSHDTAHRDNRDGRKFHQLTAHERSELPRLPKGQSYRRDGDKIVRVNDDTGAILAILGLFAVLANTR
ncbi:hypothetical protein DL237_06145 [Pseudooceanicola sediminis]|uniref:RcnB family protein n=1 Tax=Pseudooceanicola sediminis TaxID=2211117 RepID=A0A399J6V9_9RHOB|nr:hypothetical protein [Pseudooceanicola sediminis]KAA2317369.1 hypothetical protein E0K93_03520 [Puniceibacterium sp. HSS470]RII39722.1 hypothetical protein DL237_06145 [Pseudooceanicola sediminis]|tara:strand:+ start:12337 stop:12801 length:465 start_codon:yes stop_codon:yes gene_type:complete